MFRGCFAHKCAKNFSSCSWAEKWSDDPHWHEWKCPLHLWRVYFSLRSCCPSVVKFCMQKRNKVDGEKKKMGSPLLP